SLSVACNEWMHGLELPSAAGPSPKALRGRPVARRCQCPRAARDRLQCPYAGRSRVETGMFEPAVETRPWDEQHRLDDTLYRRQVAYLLQNSPFYRAKLGKAGFATPEAVGGLDAIAALPFTDKSELRESVTPDNPLGT